MTLQLINFKTNGRESMKSLFKAWVPNNDELLTESKQTLSLTKQDVITCKLF